MATFREHLKQLHKTTADFHREMANCHKDAMDNCAKDSHQHTFHKTAMDAHASHAVRCDSMHEECQKAADDDLYKLAPTRISAINRFPQGDPAAITTLIPRHGQPTLDKAADLSELPLEIQKLVSTEG